MSPYNLLFAVVSLQNLYPTHQHQRLSHGVRGLKRSSDGVSYANFAVHKFQYLHGSVVGSSCEVLQANECAFTCVNQPTCFSFNIGVSPNQNGKFICELLNEDKFRSPSKLMSSQKFHHYSIEVNNLNIFRESIISAFFNRVNFVWL